MDPRIAANRAHWNAKSAEYQARHDSAIGAAPRLWGVHAIPDDALGAIGAVDGLEVLELGCGAAQWGAALLGDGARVIGLDLSEVQLAAARRRSARLPLAQAAGQLLPFRDGCFDLVFCDHGAIGWADPNVAIPEAARVLRPGGRLVCNVASPFIEMCWDGDNGLTPRLVGDYFGLSALTEDDGATYYALGYGDWIRVFRRSGLLVENLIEPRPSTATPNTYWPSDPVDWFLRWPGESLWVTQREAD